MVEVNTRAPGKLYVAGEYAVVEPGYSAIITAVDLFIHLNIADTKNPFGTIYSEGFTEQAVKWHRRKQKVQLEPATKSLQYILAAIHTTEQYLADLGIPLKYYDLQVHSELDHEMGNKLGLGSSGAVTVATVQALLQFYEIETTDELIYKISALAQLQLGINSSFGDLAAITYTGWIKYTSFDWEAVLEYLRLYSIKETIELDWPYLKIERLNVPHEMGFLIGWTGSPASSDELVGAVQGKKNQSLEQYDHFLNVSKQAVEQLAAALLKNDYTEVARAVNKNRDALLQMGQQTNVVIETPQLTELCKIVQIHGGAAKTSGAGGGDSGIAFIFEEEKIEEVIAEWATAGITNLPLNIFTKAYHT